MITVVGFNTAIDRRIDLDILRPGAVQRATSSQPRPGGKGLHVAQTIAALGEPVCLVGLSDDEYDDALREHLRARGVEWHPVRAAQPLRQCLAIHEVDGRVTEILEPGALTNPGTRDALLAAASAAFDRSRVVVCTGSLPRGFATDTYANLVREANTRGIRCLLDASAEALREGIAAQPWLVKPNADEAASLLGRPVAGVDAAVECARQLQRNGIERVVVTLGAQGAVGVEDDTVWRAVCAEPVTVRDSVGSGDCFLAGLAVGAARGEALDVSLRRATACGVANAEGGETGYASAARVAAWESRVTVESLPAVARA